VVDGHDRPIAGAVVLIWLARPAGASGTLAAGTAGDRARPRSGHLALVPVASAAPTPASVEPPAPVEPPARPVEDQLRAAGPIAAARTGADGRFSLPILPTGRYVLFALSLGPPPATSELLMVDDGFLFAPLRLVIERRTTPLI
jgi:hypothetical protein